MIVNVLKGFLIDSVNDVYSKGKISKETREEIINYINVLNFDNYSYFDYDNFVKGNTNLIYNDENRKIIYNNVNTKVTTIKLNLKNVELNKIFIDSLNYISQVQYSFDNVKWFNFTKSIFVKDGIYIRFDLNSANEVFGLYLLYKVV